MSNMSRDPARIAIRAGLYIVLSILGMAVFGWVLSGINYLISSVGTVLLAAGFANWLSLRIFEARGLTDIGLWWNRASSSNLVIGLAGRARRRPCCCRRWSSARRIWSGHPSTRRRRAR